MIKTINCAALVFVLALFGCSDNDKENAQDITLQEPHEERTDSIPNDIENVEVVINYKTYCNQRFGYCIEYPNEILFPQGESSNGDGQRFVSKDAENTLIVFRDYRAYANPDIEYTIEMAYEEDTWGNDPEKPKRVITYKKLGQDFFVVSGYDNGDIFYQKTIISNDEFVTGILRYKESDKLMYNSMVERVFSSFR